MVSDRRNEPQGPQTRPMNLGVIEQRTGRAWADWVREIAGFGGERLAHGEIAQRVMLANPELSGWEAQGIVVAFEQHTGRRVPGQRSTGDFALAVTRTIPGEREPVRDEFARLVAALTGVLAVPWAGEPRLSDTPKRSYWRCDLADGSRVVLSTEGKGDVGATGAGAKVIASLSHEKRTSSVDTEELRTFWREVLGRLGAAA